MKRCSPVTLSPTSNSSCDNWAPPPPPPPPAFWSERTEHSCLAESRSRPRALLNGDPKIVHYLNFIVEEVNSRRKIEEYRDSSFIMYVDIQTQLQEGPTCGLLALSLVANLVRSISVDNLLHIAKAKGFTKQGEMFSARNMCSLAKEVIGEYCDVILHQHDMLHHCPDVVWDLLLNNRIFLVPYDKDKDNSPGMYSGHKAHWCVIIGICVCSGVKFYCISQGKSLKLSLWRTESLGASNKQLFEIQPDMMNSNEYVLCSIQDELAGHCISISFHENVTLPVVRTSSHDSSATQAILEHIIGNQALSN